MLAIGLMSGTSLDGVDGALIETDGVRCERFIAHTFLPYSPEFKAAFKPHLGRVPDLDSFESFVPLTRLSEPVSPTRGEVKMDDEAVSVIPAGPRIHANEGKNRHCEEGMSPTRQSRKNHYLTGSPRSLERELAMTAKELVIPAGPRIHRSDSSDVIPAKAGIQSELVIPAGPRIHRSDSSDVIPAKAGIQSINNMLDPCLRRDDTECVTNDLPSLILHLTHVHAQVVATLLKQANLATDQIDVIGFHGQTVYHQPPQEGQKGQTFQVGDGQLLANLTGIPVIFQFRQNDMAHGGQGAPLVPVFHQALAVDLPKPLAIINIGGVANVTYVGATSPVIPRLDRGIHGTPEQAPAEGILLGFDTGPGNGLIDDWMRLHQGQDYDADGAVASQGKASEEVLQIWLTHPYFQKPIPKSLDRDQFRSWCFENPLFQSLSFEDQIATLSTLTALTIAKSREHMNAPPLTWYVAGGGARNPFIMKCLERYLAPAEVRPADSIGFNGDMLEAQAFAYLAVRSLKGLPLTYPTTTGVDTPRSGGVLVRPSLERREVI